MSDSISARDDALAKLAAEAARFAPTDTPPRPAGEPLVVARQRFRPHSRPGLAAVDSTARDGAPAGYLPVAVAPERGNTRPLVPVDGRLHMRIAKPTIDALDEVVTSWRTHDPVGLRDLERATLVRVAIAMLLSDVALNGRKGAAGEAVRAALDPASRHTDKPLPQLSRWLRTAPQSLPDAGEDHSPG